MLHRLVETLIQTLKRDRSYRLEPELRVFDLGAVTLRRGMEALRGIRHRPFLGGAQGVLFVGRRVIFRHRRGIRVGRSVTFKDGAHVDALAREGIRLGNNVAIGKNAIIECTGVLRELGEGLVIGSNSNIGDFNFIQVRGKVTIGDNVLFGPHVVLVSENHVSADSSRPIKEQGSHRIGVTIENDCWIGAHVTILDGVRICHGSIIAAGAVVTKDVSAHSIMAGVPAKLIRSRLEVDT
jgi:acetyltransferase-like isoleucine patch superfamily enzyme